MASNTPPGANQDPRAPWNQTERYESVEIELIEDLGDDRIRVNMYSDKRGNVEIIIYKDEILEIAWRKFLEQ